MEDYEIHMMSARTLETQRSFTHALIELMCVYPYNEITVKEIVARAKRTRQTFYRHFTSKQDVLDRQLDSMYNVCYALINKLPTPTLDSALTTYFTYWYQYRDTVKRLLEVNRSTTLMRELTLKYAAKLYPLIKQYMKRSYDEPVDEFYFQQFIFGGLVQMKMQWFSRGCDVPPEQMARKLLSFWRESL